MAPDERQREIERHEQWLREVGRDEFDFDVERIKTRVRIAVGEQWLARQLKDQSPAALSDRTKRRVRTGLSRLRHGSAAGSAVAGRKRSSWAWYHRLGAVGLAAAACLLAAVGVRSLQRFGWEVSPRGGPARPPVSTPIDELPMVAAFESFAEDELTQSLAMLERDLDDLESSWDQWALHHAFDAGYEDLFDVENQ